MLPREQQQERKNQDSQSEETEQFTATLHINFPHQVGVVDLLHKVKVWESRPATGRSAFQTPSGLR
jgi:hypothetical protein